jgi:hypothetical protein
MAIGCHDSILVVVRAENGDPYKIGFGCSEYQAAVSKKPQSLAHLTDGARRRQLIKADKD